MQLTNLLIFFHFGQTKRDRRRALLPISSTFRQLWVSQLRAKRIGQEQKSFVTNPPVSEASDVYTFLDPKDSKVSTVLPWKSRAKAPPRGLAFSRISLLRLRERNTYIRWNFSLYPKTEPVGKYWKARGAQWRKETALAEKGRSVKCAV